jgi:hypothetical protein
MSNNNTKGSSRASGTDYTLSPGAPEFALCCVYKHYKGFVYFDYTYRLISIALFDDFNLIISIFHCLCPSFYLYLSNLLS